MALVIEQCQVAPSLGSSDKMTLPLTYFDILWLHNQHVPRILFYKLPIDKNSFVQTIIPTLKHSLSLTLKHYLPLAGNLVCPLDSSGSPELRYVKGDSVSVTFSESNMNFDYLVSNDHPCYAKDFHPLVPQLTKPKDVSGVRFAAVFAIQVTLFPNYNGISICFINHHVVGDGSTIVAFIKAWASLNKYGGNDEFMIPFYDRSIVKDPHGLRDILWDGMKKYMTEMNNVIVTPPNDIVRGTFIIRRDDIQKLKNLISSRRPRLTHVTSYTVTCSYIWTCLIKSEAATHEVIDKNVMEYFSCSVDYRSRFDPPLPSSYFGNCIIWYISRIRHVDLAGNEGFTIAAESIGETIDKRSNDMEYMLSGEWLNEVEIVDKSRYLAVAGSPKLDLYEADFGWGRPHKWEFVSLDGGILMSLSKSKDSNGDLQIGLSLPKTRMNAFTSIFTQGLEEINANKLLLIVQLLDN